MLYEVITRIFKDTEGNDIHPAASVAAATLISAVRDGLVVITSYSIHYTKLYEITGDSDMNKSQE